MLAAGPPTPPQKKEHWRASTAVDELALDAGFAGPSGEKFARRPVRSLVFADFFGELVPASVSVSVSVIMSVSVSLFPSQSQSQSLFLSLSRSLSLCLSLSKSLPVPVSVSVQVPVSSRVHNLVY